MATIDGLRWLPFKRGDGPRNMAVDEVLLHTAVEMGIGSFRTYGWTQATASLGYFQSFEVLKASSNLKNLPWVRRPSGGKTLVHHHELTYALALPPGFDPNWMPRMHERILLPALETLGLAGKIQVVGVSQHQGDVLCFQQQTPGDLICAGHKVVGSAQRKHHQGLLQHGAILLAQSEFTPELPGLRELAGVALAVENLEKAILKEMARETGWRLQEGPLSSLEEKQVEDLIPTKYASASWNEKR